MQAHKDNQPKWRWKTAAPKTYQGSCSEGQGAAWWPVSRTDHCHWPHGQAPAAPCLAVKKLKNPVTCLQAINIYMDISYLMFNMVYSNWWFAVFYWFHREKKSATSQTYWLLFCLNRSQRNKNKTKTAHGHTWRECVLCVFYTGKEAQHLLGKL